MGRSELTTFQLQNLFILTYSKVKAESFFFFFFVSRNGKVEFKALHGELFDNAREWETEEESATS